MGHRFFFKFSKDAEMIYTSHLDLMRLFSRAARRADLPVALTQGFSPHPKIKLKRALKLGLASDEEEGEIILEERITEDEVLKRFQAQLPSGIEIREVKVR